VEGVEAGFNGDYRSFTAHPESVERNTRWSQALSLNNKDTYKVMFTKSNSSITLRVRVCVCVCACASR